MKVPEVMDSFRASSRNCGATISDWFKLKPPHDETQKCGWGHAFIPVGPKSPHELYVFICGRYISLAASHPSVGRETAGKTVTRHACLSFSSVQYILFGNGIGGGLTMNPQLRINS